MKPMSVPRSNIGLVALDGLLYAVGGYDGRSPIRWGFYALKFKVYSLIKIMGSVAAYKSPFYM